MIYNIKMPKISAKMQITACTAEKCEGQVMICGNWYGFVYKRGAGSPHWQCGTNPAKMHGEVKHHKLGTFVATICSGAISKKQKQTQAEA